ncbi:MAG: LysR family transcriptional regulator, partial [Rhodobacteraceae bacterium]|nr:LysR family transcriptional regulator [Paracoccaceae bacterium]
MRLHLNLNRLVYFSAVVEAGSFSAAANRLGITKAVVSQQISRLEEETASTLFARNSRRISLTDAGRQLHQRCLLILKEAEEAFGELNEGASVPRGTLRITAPFDYGVEIMTPQILAFRAAHPACEVELHLSDRKVDLLADGLDLAIRVGWLMDSALISRRIGAFRQLLVASPALIERNGLPGNPSELARFP